jgi:hypothetical protein
LLCEDAPNEEAEIVTAKEQLEKHINEEMQALRRKHEEQIAELKELLINQWTALQQQLRPIREGVEGLKRQWIEREAMPKAMTEEREDEFSSRLIELEEQQKTFEKKLEKKMEEGFLECRNQLSKFHDKLQFY